MVFHHIFDFVLDFKNKITIISANNLFLFFTKMTEKLLPLLKAIPWIYTKDEIFSWFYLYSKRQAQEVFSNLLKMGVFEYIAPNKYLFKDWFGVSEFDLMTQFDRSSYISLYSVLCWRVFKQISPHFYAITSWKTQELKLPKKVNVSEAKFNFYHSSVPQTFWITFVGTKYKMADLERAFLDLLYLSRLWKIGLNKEMYLSELNEDKIKLYLKFYPKFVESFYLKVKKEYAITQPTRSFQTKERVFGQIVDWYKLIWVV